MTANVAVEVLIRGRVQGVWFRAWTENEATRRALSGWVRNNPDRTVSALFVGPRPAVEAMLAACRVGPPDARVEGIETVAVDPPLGGSGFRVLR
jgi:acylphosphatase